VGSCGRGEAVSEGRRAKWCYDGGVRRRTAVLWALTLLAGCQGVLSVTSNGDAIDGQAPRDGGGTVIDAPGVDSSIPPGDTGPPSPASCADPAADWLLCEDFEAGGGDFATWFAASDFVTANGEGDPGRLALSSAAPHAGRWAIHMPAAAGSGYQGGDLGWYACEGAQRTNCPLRSYDQLHFRVFVRFASTHEYVHHFLNIGGSQPDQFWSLGAAGCLPDGEKVIGTTVDHHPVNHETFFYTYFPEMSCDTACERYADVAASCADCASKGLPTCDVQPQCCWGNSFEPSPPVPFPVDRWFCFEMMMRANTPGAHDGTMAYWIDGALVHQVDGMMWRTSPTLALNRVRVQHYIETEDAGGHSNPVWFDDVVVSTGPIGCDRF